MNIVLSGPDGTGKSTMVEGIKRHLINEGEVQVSWRRFGFILARTLNLTGRAMGLSHYEKTPLGLIGYHHYRGAFARIYIAVSFVDCLLFIIPKWWLHDQLNRPKKQIVDRYLIDIAADLILSTESPRSVLWFFDGILKHHVRTESCILLTCDPKVVMERRPDIKYDKNYRKKVRIYSLLRRKYGIAEVATDESTPEACLERTLFLCAS